MPYPCNLNTSDPRSPEYSHWDRDQAEAEALEQQAERDAAKRKAVCDLDNSVAAWEDTPRVDESQAAVFGELAPAIVRLADALPERLTVCRLYLDTKNDTAILRLLSVAERLAKLRFTRRSEPMQAVIADEIKALECSLLLIERAEALQ